jgi:tetratricopeptide (TPR) repeat protein
VRFLTAAAALRPESPGAHINLGRALHAKGRVNEAIASYRRALDLDPKLAAAHNNLGSALLGKGRLDEAIVSYRRALDLDPTDALAHHNLGAALEAKGLLDEAIASYRRALDLDPKLAAAHYNLGNALEAKGRLNEAIASYRRAVEADPNYAAAHNNLGNALAGKGQVDEAIASYRCALDIDSKLAEAHCNLGQALHRKGRFAESLASLRRGHELGSKQPGWQYPSGQWVRDAERLAALEGKLPAILRGEHAPADNADRLALAEVCVSRKLHRALARLYADAFAADPKLADDMKVQHRYNAACHAALAAAGRGEDAAGLAEGERLALRRRALTWLRADLTLYCRRPQADTPAGRAELLGRLRHWQQDADLAGLRDAAALAKLPPEERAACERLWADLAALLARATEKRP